MLVQQTEPGREVHVQRGAGRGGGGWDQLLGRGEQSGKGWRVHGARGGGRKLGGLGGRGDVFISFRNSS